MQMIAQRRMKTGQKSEKKFAPDFAIAVVPFGGGGGREKGEINRLQMNFQIVDFFFLQMLNSDF